MLTIDGVGEWATSSIGAGRGGELELIRELRFPHSLGLLYSAFTYFTGFRVNSGEYKVMGLAPYGEPKYVRAIKDHLLEIGDDGSLWMNMEYFTYPHGLRMTGSGFESLFGGPARQPEAPLTQREMDLARSVQEITEEVMLKMARFARRETGLRDLCLAGGVALNCVGNGHILRERIFDDIWIQPAAGAREPGIDRRVGAAVDDAARNSAALRRRHERIVSRSAVRRRRRAIVCRRARDPRAPVRASRAREARRVAPRRGESRRPPAGPHGVRAARARRPLDRRGSAFAAHAVDDEPEDQVPRRARAAPRVRTGGTIRGT